MSPYLSVIIPAYNEETRITQTLQSVYDFLDRQEYNSEIFVVLDGATDNTLARVKHFGATRAGVRWVDRRENRGKGYSVRQGMLAARGRIRLFMDADNSTDVSHFEKMEPLFETGCDVAICSRDPRDAKGAQQAVKQPWLRRLLGGLGNRIIQQVVPGIWDTQCGFKAFTAPAAERIFERARIDGWGFDIEVLALARKLGCRYGIVPAYWVDMPGSHVKLRSYLEVLAQTVRIRCNLTWRRYDGPSSTVGPLLAPTDLRKRETTSPMSRVESSADSLSPT